MWSQVSGGEVIRVIPSPIALEINSIQYPRNIFTVSFGVGACVVVEAAGRRASGRFIESSRGSSSRGILHPVNKIATVIGIARKEFFTLTLLPLKVVQ